jgi:hypothetical protein
MLWSQFQFICYIGLFISVYVFAYLALVYEHFL